MQNLLNLWLREPARLVSFTTAFLALVVAFGVQVTTEQQSAIVGLVIAVVSIVGGEITRANVYAPNTVSEIVANVGTPDTITLGDDPTAVTE
jgi:hypothetical protein